MSIYKPCDIRGDAAAELTPELYQSWGRALGLRLPARSKFLVGGDVRASTPAFQAALVDGLCHAGLDVVDLGQLPTPMVYHGLRRLGAAGCAIVTASHGAAELNGLKWMIGNRPPTPADVQALACDAQTAVHELPERARRRPRALDISFDYVAWLQETWVDALVAEGRIVLDPMYGCAARRARRYLQAIFPQCLISAIHDQPDAVFVGRCPDCSRAQFLEELCETVYRERAQLGLAFDGDGDRVALVDDQGIVLTAEEAAWTLLQTFGRELRGERVVCDLKFSDRIAEAAGALGAEALIERSGHAFIRGRMLQARAVFGAEISGHYFYRDLDGADDGLFTACRLIAHLARCGQTLSELRAQCPAVFITPDLRVSLPPVEHEAVIQQVRKIWAQHPQTTLDGVRIEFPNGWALVRSSVTEAALTFRFEAAEAAWLNELVRRFCNALPCFGEELWYQYVAANEGPL